MQVFNIFVKWTYIPILVIIKYSIAVDIVNLLKGRVSLLLLMKTVVLDIKLSLLLAVCLLV